LKAPLPKPFPSFIVLLLFLSLNNVSYSSENSERKWLSPNTTFYTDDLLGSDDEWKEAFEEAANRWNDVATRFWIRTVRESGDSGFCTSEGRNSTRWSSTLCGDEWGENTLAVTSSFSSGGFLYKADIVFNNTKEWDIYDGVLRFYASDFRRVAVHELGHAMGLSHLSDTRAIMAEFASDTFLPQFDDYAALFSKYGNDYHTLTLKNNGTGKIIVEPKVLGTGVSNTKTNILMQSQYDFLDCAEPVCEILIQDGLRLDFFATPEASFLNWTETTIDSSSITAGSMFFDRTLTANYSTGTNNTGTTIPIAPVPNILPTSSSVVSISWNTVSESTSYQVHRCSSSATTSCGESITSTSASTYSDAGGSSGISYYYRVKACNSAGCSPFSTAVIGLKTFAKPPKPITSVSSTYVIVAWANTQRAESTQLYRCTTATTTSCGSPIETTTKTVLTDTSGIAGIEYFYRIKFCNGSICSEFSDSVSGTKTATIIAPSSPSEPSLSSSTNGVTLLWSNISAATSYEIYRCSSINASSCGSKIGDSTTISFTDTAGTAGVSYYYRLKACNLNICSGLGDYALGIKSAAIAKPLAPSTLEISNSSTEVSLSWIAVIGADSYLIYTCTNDELSSCGVFPKSSASLSLDITDGIAGETYYYRVKSCNSSGCSDFNSCCSCRHRFREVLLCCSPRDHCNIA
jgi:hypothetical protein